MQLKKVNSFSRQLSYSLKRLFFFQFMTAHSRQLDLKFRFKAEDVVGRHIYKYDMHEVETTNALLREVKINPDDIVLDIGANIGWYSMFFAKQGALVHAFEPDPLNYKLLKENIALNRFEESIEAHETAVSDKKTSMPLYLNPNSNRGRHSLNPNIGRKTINVEVVRLDDYLETVSIDIEKIKCIKIDIEGHEYPALKGATKLLEHVPYLLVEYGPEHIRKGGYNPVDILNLLDSYHYTPYVISENNIQKTTIAELAIDEDEFNVFWCKQTTTSA